MTAIAAGQAKWQNLTMDYPCAARMRAVTEWKSGKRLCGACSSICCRPARETWRKRPTFAARLARGSVFADNLRELAEDFRTEQTLQAM